MAKQIIGISLGSSEHDHEFHTQMFGETVRVRRLGVDGDITLAARMIEGFDGQADAIGLDGVTAQFRVGRRTYVHRQIQQLTTVAKVTPVADGAHLSNTLERWAVSQVALQQPGIFAHKRVFVASGIHHYPTAKVLSAHTPLISFGDPILHLNLPFALGSMRQLERFAEFALPSLCRAPYDRLWPTGDRESLAVRRTKRLEKAHIVAGNLGDIRRFASHDLAGKVLITGGLSAADVEDLRAQGVECLITSTPPLGDEQAFVSNGILAAILASFVDQPANKITQDDYLDLLSASDWEPRITVLNKAPDVAKFAFVIHPLSADDLFNHPQLKYLRFLPKGIVERVMANIRPLYLSRITGVKSPDTGQEVEGYLLSLGATPKELMRRRPGHTYRRLIVASRMAQQLGAQIMGLGAFTKVVGDAGMTVAYKSDIAITSGNSLTVAATLEAAKQAVLKMGGRVDKGQAVVIGATGSIGSVCSRLIAQAVHNVVLVAPRPEKLIALKQTIEEETPKARVTIATDAGRHLPDADLVVTTTTAIGQKVIDVLQLKPGCVVCDVARPPDVTEKDAGLRPDVLVVESGEILLPGEPDFGFNIGLPPGVAYACLAEAAVLAMEGRFENFTLGRNIEMDRVKEMYRLFQKHGLQLEGMRSFGRYVSAEDLEKKRALANELRQHPEKLDALIAQGKRTEAGPQERSRKRVPWILAGAGAVVVALAWIFSPGSRSKRFTRRGS